MPSASRSISFLFLATDTVDHEGEGDALSAGIDYFDTAINRIIIAVRRLAKLGYGRIVITADHGFIIGDDGVETGRAAQLPRADRRYVLGEPRFGEELVSVHCRSFSTAPTRPGRQSSLTGPLTC